MKSRYASLLGALIVAASVAVASSDGAQGEPPEGESGAVTEDVGTAPEGAATPSRAGKCCEMVPRRSDPVEAVLRARPELAGLEHVPELELARPPWDDWEGRISAGLAHQEEVPGGAALALMRPCWIRTRQPNVACSEMYEALGDGSGGFRGYVEVASTRVSEWVTGALSKDRDGWETMEALLWLTYYAGDPQAFEAAYTIFTDAFVETQGTATTESRAMMEAFAGIANDFESLAVDRYPRLDRVAKSMCASLPSRAALGGRGYLRTALPYVLATYPMADLRRRCVCAITRYPEGRSLCGSAILAEYSTLCCTEAPP